MQLMDERFPNVYACGDVSDTGVRNPNSRAAMSQAKIAADNIVLAALGKQPSYTYKHHWAESVIKLTLGLVRTTSPPTLLPPVNKKDRINPSLISRRTKQSCYST